MDAPKVDLKRVEEFLVNNPAFLVMLGAVALTALQKHGKVPAWAKDLPSIGGRVAGAWRGPGSFGKGFGSQVRHR